MATPNKPPPSSNDVGGRDAPLNGILQSMDRRAMEEARLARLGKRRASPEGPQAEPPSQKRKIELDTTPKTPGTSLPFSRCAVRHTWAKGSPRQADDITIEEVLQKDELELAVVSSFQWDEEWLLSKLRMSRTRLMCIAYAANDATKAAMRANSPANFRFCFPRTPAFGNMHAKLMLLKYQGYLRIVISTGNLVDYDWGETGVLENMVFLVDVPKLAESQPPHETQFSREMIKFVAAMGLDQSLIRTLGRYDFSGTEGLAFVHSVPGVEDGDECANTGFFGLSQAVKDLGLQTSGPIEADYVCASIGSLSGGLIANLYRAFQGRMEMGIPERKKKAPPAEQESGWKDRMRIHFPSRQTVLESKEPSAGTICFLRKWWESAKCPQSVFRDCKATRPGQLIHSKAIFVQQDRGGYVEPTWVYVGSANLSESAWGRLVKSGQSGKPRVDCRNWECGVLLPVISAAASEEPDAGRQDTSGFGRVAPVPMQLPGRKYQQSGSGSHPWFYQEP